MKTKITLTAAILAAVLLVSAPALVSAQTGTAGSGNVLQAMQSSLRGVTQKILQDYQPLPLDPLVDRELERLERHARKSKA